MFQAGYFPPAYFSPEWWDEVDATTIQGGCFLLALHGTGGATEVVEIARRPKSSSAVKLQRIKDGKAWLVGSRSAARAHEVSASGFTPTVVLLPEIPGRATALPGVSKSVCRKTIGVGAARGTLAMSSASTISWQVQVVGTSRISLLQGMCETAAAISTTRGGAVATVLSSTAATSCERAHSRGCRNLSDTEVILIAKMFTDK